MGLPVTPSERVARRAVLLRAERFTTIETLLYVADEDSDDDSPPPPTSEPVGGTPWRDMAGDAITTAQALMQGGYAQCSLATARNLYRDQSFSMAELAANSVGSDIRFPLWEKVLEPLRNDGEVYRRFIASRVRSELLVHVRLAARSRTNSRHVTALVCADGSTFRHYDNDSKSRQGGTFASVSLRALWGPFMLFALIKEGSDLHRSVDALPALEAETVVLQG